MSNIGIESNAITEGFEERLHWELKCPASHYSFHFSKLGERVMPKA